MGQTFPTTCPHNAEGQKLVPGVQTKCRMCGAAIEPAPAAVNAENKVSPGELSANYPGVGAAI